MTPEEAWALLLEETDGDPDPTSTLDFIASNSEGWQAHVASLAYMRSLGAKI